MKTPESSQAVPPVFIGKWTPEILFSLNEKPYRHGQLRRRLGSISQRMLTRNLRNLESTRLIARSETGSKGVVVEYSLTPLGRGFITPLKSLCKWAKQHRKDISAELRIGEARQRQ